PSTPISASFFMLAQGKVPSMYFAAFGLNSFSTNSRTVATMLRCCSVRLKSTCAAFPWSVFTLFSLASSLRGAKRRSNPESRAETLDCFAEPVIGPRVRADPLARNDVYNDELHRSRGVMCPRLYKVNALIE